MLVSPILRLCPASSTPTLRATVAIAPDSAQQADRVDQLMLQGSFGHVGWGGGARVWLPALPMSGTALNTHKNAFIVLVENVLGAALITDDLIRRGNHTSVQALDIRSWAKAWNENAKPFIWTKTAEQILESLRRLLTRINGAQH
jgi:hypothetical protein